MAEEVRELLALDVGQARTGIARANTAARLAEPLMSLPTAEILPKLDALIKEHSAQTLVVGLPRNLRGDDTGQTAWVRDWVTKAKDRIELPIYWQDEALTSKLAAAKAQNSKIKAQKIDEHALAAAIILQDFLDTPEAERTLS